MMVATMMSSYSIPGEGRLALAVLVLSILGLVISFFLGRDGGAAEFGMAAATGAAGALGLVVVAFFPASSHVNSNLSTATDNIQILVAQGSDLNEAVDEVAGTLADGEYGQWDFALEGNALRITGEAEAPGPLFIGALARTESRCRLVLFSNDGAVISRSTCA